MDVLRNILSIEMQRLDCTLVYIVSLFFPELRNVCIYVLSEVKVVQYCILTDYLRKTSLFLFRTSTQALANQTDLELISQIVAADLSSSSF
jgi:hypothetical protein